MLPLPLPLLSPATSLPQDAHAAAPPGPAMAAGKRSSTGPRTRPTPLVVTCCLPPPHAPGAAKEAGSAGSTPSHYAATLRSPPPAISQRSAAVASSPGTSSGCGPDRWGAGRSLHQRAQAAVLTGLDLDPDPDLDVDLLDSVVVHRGASSALATEPDLATVKHADGGSLDEDKGVLVDIDDLLAEPAGQLQPRDPSFGIGSETGSGCNGAGSGVWSAVSLPTAVAEAVAGGCLGM